MSESVGVRFDEETLDWLDGHDESRGAVVKRAVRYYRQQVDELAPLEPKLESAYRAFLEHGRDLGDGHTVLATEEARSIAANVTNTNKSIVDVAILRPLQRAGRIDIRAKYLASKCYVKQPAELVEEVREVSP